MPTEEVFPCRDHGPQAVDGFTPWQRLAGNHGAGKRHKQRRGGEDDPQPAGYVQPWRVQLG